MMNFVHIIKDKVIKFATQNKRKLYLSISFGLVGVSLLHISYKKFNSSQTQRKWQQIANSKKAYVQNQIEQFKQDHLITFNIDFELKKDILSSNISQLRQIIYEGKASVRQVLLTFIQRTVQFGQDHNLITDVLFNQALEIAMLEYFFIFFFRKQDEALKINKEIIFQEGNELYGVPISFKDMIMVKGTDTTYGLASRLKQIQKNKIRCFKPDQVDSFHAKRITDSGGIIFVKTNIPQIGMTFESNNYIFGAAKNPWDICRTSGGSSGGEGGLIALQGSIIGIGSDIGGSIRIPSSFNGICGYKTSSGRCPISGHGRLPTTIEGIINLTIISGPLARCVDDLVIIMKILFNSEKYRQLPQIYRDSHFIPIDFNPNEYTSKRKLRISYLKSVDLVPSCQANRRGIDLALQILASEGHEIVPFEIDQNLFIEAIENYFKFICADADFEGFYVNNFFQNLTFKELLNGEKYIPQYNENVSLSKLPKWMVVILEFLSDKLNYQRYSLMFKILKIKPTAYQQQYFSGIQKKLKEELALIWEKQGIDILITPVTASVAIKHNQVNTCLLSCIYTFLWNFFDYSAGVVTVTKVEQNEQFYQDDEKFSRSDETSLTLKEAMKGSVGMPVSVQVVALPHNDELCLRVMKEIQNKVNFSCTPIPI